MEISESTLTKIENLLKLANHERTSKEEAQAAMLAAQRLAARHQVDLAQLNIRPEVEEEVITEGVKFMKNASFWRYQVVKVIGENFRCKAYRQLMRDRQGSKAELLSLAGLKSDVAIASKIAVFAIEFAEKGVVVYAKGGLFNISGTHKEAREIRDSWLAGYIHGLSEVFAKQVQENKETALMVVVPQKVEDYFQDLGTRKLNMNVPKVSVLGAFNTGYKEGKNFQGPQEQLAQ